MPYFWAIRIEGNVYKPGDLVLLDDLSSEVKTLEDSKVILLGGDKWEVVPYIYWNLVSFSKERVE
ncbi:hypothetical protein [Pseudoalteromonas luteoviolacea]|uniref:Uncharacterized protein n=1 Tax=Pseudoalteromonas luteoviolacea NCIMB 1942 TaxID=1365253 RepID=A0A167CKH9_9GAMM|nr:hypothetical protein [Pseudoalteromonas luteoviolacea]KZN47770.1 hypothetical protein N482_09090 [Pseudoalteromonas luteoviolacea NCIMB 1942]